MICCLMFWHVYFGLKYSLFKLCSLILQCLFYVTLVPPSGHYLIVPHIQNVDSCHQIKLLGYL